jgi:hypothetical protein
MDMGEVWRQLRPLHGEIWTARESLRAEGIDITGCSFSMEGKIVITVQNLTPDQQRQLEERFGPDQIRVEKAKRYYRLRHPIRLANNMVHAVLRWRRHRSMRKLEWHTAEGPVAFDDLPAGMMAHAVAPRGRFWRRRRPI